MSSTAAFDSESDSATLLLLLSYEQEVTHSMAELLDMTPQVPRALRMRTMKVSAAEDD
jgi:hypothetical protein